MENEVKNNSKCKNIIIVVLSVIIVILIAILVYYGVIKDDKKVNDNNNNNNSNANEVINKQVSEMPIDLYLDEKENQVMDRIRINNKVFEVKLVRNNKTSENNDLYLNGKKIMTTDHDSITVSGIEDYLIIAWPGAMSGNLALGYADKSENYFPIYDNGIEIYNVYFDEDKYYCFILDENSDFYDTKIAELKLNGNNITIIDNH